jgi:hypothetical protein
MPGKNPAVKMAPEVTRPNRLANEKSPYLLQHANNPVDWYPWGTEAFSRAAREDKPVFLSIGYTTCHWCHVMAHESFEDTDVAGLLNRDFVCVKVDREERPDIDGFYMAVSQMMTGRGGWPLTIVMTPEKKPFFAATYIPKESRFGMAGLSDLLPRLATLWRERRTELLDSAGEILDALRPEPRGKSSAGPDHSLLSDCYEELVLRFDAGNGGFGNAPKFPTPHVLLFLLRYWKRTGKGRALAMVEKTLLSMARGGIHDHLGGGFHRYSTDARWRVPHFEKMLYDQALLLMAYTEAFEATRKQEYREIAEEIVAYVLRDLTSPEGTFYSAEDADSEGSEGTFYLWTTGELERVLGHDDAGLAAQVFSIAPEGNFTEQESAGKNILYQKRPVHELAAELNIPCPQLVARLETIQMALFRERSKRPRPVCDDKELTDWNGLFIAALARASWVFDNTNYRKAAEKAMRVLLSRMRSPGGSLLHRYRDGEVAIPAFGDDYAYVIMALIQLYGSSSDPEYLSEALRLQVYFTTHFNDAETGGYFSVSDLSEDLPVRSKEIYDGALPSCNSVAFDNFVRLAEFTGDERFGEMAAEIARTFLRDVAQSPASYTWFVGAVNRALGPSQQVVIAGETDETGTLAMMGAIRSHYLPLLSIHALTSAFRRDEIAKVVGFVEWMVPVEGRATAYVCSGKSCAVPVTDTKKMLELLGLDDAKTG